MEPQLATTKDIFNAFNQRIEAAMKEVIDRMELRKQASYYHVFGEKLIKNQGYPIDIMGDGSPLFPISEYTGVWSECQPNK